MGLRFIGDVWKNASVYRPTTLVDNNVGRIFGIDDFPLTSTISRVADDIRVSPAIFDLKNASAYFTCPRGFSVLLKPFITETNDLCLMFVVCDYVVGAEPIVSANNPRRLQGMVWYDDNEIEDLYMAFHHPDVLIHSQVNNTQVGTTEAIISNLTSLYDWKRQMYLYSHNALALVALWTLAMKRGWGDVDTIPFFQGVVGGWLLHQVGIYIEENEEYLLSFMK